MKILIRKNVALASATTVMTLEQEENGLSVPVVNGYTKTVLRLRMLCMMLMEKKNCAHCVSNLVCCILAQKMHLILFVIPLLIPCCDYNGHYQKSVLKTICNACGNDR